MIDRYYDKIIILCYPAGAGGNFLINCLSLSDQCVLRDAVLASQQITSGTSTEEKIKYFQNCLNKSLSDQTWQDLNLGCSNLFGVNHNIYFFEYPEIIQKKFNYVIKQLIDQKKYLFIVAHTTQSLNAYLKFWHQARVIFLTDYHDFINRRNYAPTLDVENLTHYWSMIKGESWPNFPPLCYKEFLQLPETIQQELIIDFHGEIFKWVKTSPTVEELHDQTVSKYISQLGSQTYVWSVEKNFTGNEQQFLEDLSQCAQWAGIKIDASDGQLIDYYKQWLYVIFKIAEINQPVEPA